jgi:hypothetical protein
MRHLLGNFIIKTHTRRYGKSLVDFTTPRNYAWWYVPKEDTAQKKIDLFLTSLELKGINQPDIIYLRKGTRETLNAFHPEDRIILESKAVKWKSGLLARALEKTKGCL